MTAEYVSAVLQQHSRQLTRIGEGLKVLPSPSTYRVVVRVPQARHPSFGSLPAQVAASFANRLDFEKAHAGSGILAWNSARSRESMPRLAPRLPERSGLLEAAEGSSRLHCHLLDKTLLLGKVGALPGRIRNANVL